MASDDDDFEEVKPKKKRPVRSDDYDDDDDRDERPRKKKKGDATGGVIPYKNSKALISYYCGVFSLIPGLGMLLGPIAVILGFLGFSYASKNPEARGKGHAIVGIILGGLVSLAYLGLIVLLAVGLIKGK